MTTQCPQATRGPEGDSGERVRVLIADDDRGIREALSELISDDPGLNLVGAFADAEAAIAFASDSCADVAVIDLSMPGGGVYATRRVIELCPRTRVIALSAHNDRASCASMLEAGALRYLVKGAVGVDVVSTIWEVASASSTEGDTSSLQG